MFIQTNPEGRIVGMMEAIVTAPDGTVIEQDTTGYFEVDLPDGFDSGHITNYLYKDGAITYDEDPDLIAERDRSQEIADLNEATATLPDAVAELSEVVSDGSEELSDAIADLSALVSSLITKENANG